MAIQTRYKPVLDKQKRPILDADGKPKRRPVAFTVVVNVPDDYVIGQPNPIRGKGQREVIGTYANKTQAKAAEGAAKQAIKHGTYETRATRDARHTAEATTPKVWTVADVVQGWLAGRKSTVSTNTYSQYESAYRLHLKDALGNRELAAVTRADVKAALRTWQEAGMGAQLQNRTMLVLRCALDEAVEDGLIAANPATRIKLPSPKKRRDIAQWTPSQLRAFLAEAERDQLGVFWSFAALEGMRRAECLGARWSDVTWGKDDATAALTITQTVIPSMTAGGTATIQPRAKTKRSQRTITLTSVTVAALQRHRDRQAFQQQAAGELWADLDLIVCDEIGRPIRPDSVDAHRKAVMNAAGVPVIGTHGLRHGAASRMLKAGVPIATVAEKLGHEDVSLTYDTYGHLAAEDQSLANVAIEAFLDRDTATTG